MSSQTANVIDLRSYRERRRALELAEAPIVVQNAVQPLPFYAPAFFFGYWPCWIMAPIPMIMADWSGEATYD
jgi:hypothetical protein